MNRRTQGLPWYLCVATMTLPFVLSSTEALGFQFSFQSRHTVKSHWHSKPYPSPRHSSTLKLSHQQRWSHGIFRGNRTHYSAGYYALPYYWGNNQHSVYNHQSGHIPDYEPGYPSHISAYDSEFRTGAKISDHPTTASADPSPVTITNEHFGTSPQQVESAHFDLQQRLLHSRQTPSIKSATAASNLQGHAEKAFRAGRYYDAAYYSNQAVEADPYNGIMRLFCSQCNFAIEKYSVAMLMLEQATTMLPETKWDYVVKHYDTFYGQNDYVTQSLSLANYLKRRPDDNRARTLLGYHYGCLGYKTTASKLFHQSLQTYRNDDLAQRLLPIFGDSNYASTVVKKVDAPTPELLDAPVVGHRAFESGIGNRLIYLTPQQTAVPQNVETLPSPEEIFFDQSDSGLLPALESPE